MDKKRKIIDVKACNLCESLQPDLEIQIEGRCFKLNKVLTAGILHFYRAKLNMFENKSEVLNGINLSIEMFDEFLHTVQDYYKHKNSLWTTENLLALWDAVRIFQNPFLIINCETKVGEIISEENFETIYTKANHYKSDIVLYKARKYVHEFSWKKETDQLSLTRILTFNDFFYLLKEDSFIFEMQDKVLKSIFDWVENRDNQHPYSGVSTDELDKLSVTTRENEHDNRNSCKEYTKLEDKSSLLSRLLKALKINSVSIECLEEMSRHHLCEQDHEAKDVITKAISFKQDKSTHGFWPPDAHEGHILNYQHIGVLADKDRVSFMNLGNSNYCWHRLTRCPLHSQITNLTVFDNELYVISSADFESLIFVLRNKEWKFVLDIPNKDFRVVSKGKFIYLIEGTRSSVKCLWPRETPVLHSEIKFPDMMRTPESALDFDKSILIFCSTDSDEKSTVFCLDVPDHKWTDCGHLEGSAKNLVGFRNETNYFILQSDGTVRQVLRNQADGIVFTVIKRLWSIQSAVRGAFIYSDMLYIFSNTPMESSCLCGVSGVFSKIEYWYQEQEACDFVQFFMPMLDICQSESIYDSDYDYDDESDN